MGNVIKSLESLQARVFNLEFINDNYYEWKKEKEDFIKHLEKKAKEISKNRAKDGVRDDKQQVVSASK